MSKFEHWESLFPCGTQTSEDDESSAVTLGEGPHDDIMEEKKKDKPNKSAHLSKAEVFSDVSRSFENPPSWVSPICLDRSQYLMRYPPYGRRTVQYYCAKADFFSRNTHPQVSHFYFCLKHVTSFVLTMCNEQLCRICFPQCDATLHQCNQYNLMLFKKLVHYDTIFIYLT